MSLIGRINDLAARVAEEFNTVREYIGDVEDALDGHTHPIADITNLQATLDSKASTSHTHAATDVTAGTFSIARLPVATSGTSNTTQVVRADDSRLSNARPPTAHTHAIADITSLQTILDGKAAASHTHATSQITSGTFDIARIPTGTTSATVALGNHTHTLASLGAAAAIHSHAIEDVTGLQTALDGKATSSHTHTAANITSGTFDIARIPVAASGTSSTTQVVRADDTRLYDARTPLAHTHAIADIAATGTASSATFLRGDGTWATPTNTTYTTISQAEAENSASTTARLVTGQRMYQAIAAHARLSSWVPSWTDVTGKPTTFTPATHTHAIADVTNLQTTLDGKAAASHTHTKSQITDFAHTHAIADITGLQAALGSRFGTGDVITNGPFWTSKNLYFADLHDVMFRAEQRWSVVGTMHNKATDAVVSTLTMSQLGLLFDNNHDAGITISAGNYLKLSITFDKTNSGTFPGYPYGEFYWTHYHTSQTESAQVRVYTTYAPQTPGWKTLPVEDVVRESTVLIQKANNTFYQITNAEFTFTAPDDISAQVVSLMWFLNRPTSATEQPYVGKYKTEYLYNKLIWRDSLGNSVGSIDTSGVVDFPHMKQSGVDLVRTDDSRLTDARTPTTHTHTKSQITDFAHTHAIADLPVAASGTSSSTQLVRADDSRLSDARTPLAHGHALTDSNITGILPIAQIPTGTTASTVALGNHTHTPASIGAAAASHTHPELSGSVPTGAMLDFAGSTAPTGFLLCDGAAVSRSTYAALFAVIGTTYGAGNGSTTFNLPDTRMRVTLGGPGSSPYSLGYSDGVSLASRSPSHSHSTPGHSHTATTTVALYDNELLIGSSSSGITGSAGDHSHTAASAGSHTHTTGTPSNSPVNTWSMSGNSGSNAMPRAAQYDSHTHTAGSAGAHTHTTNTTGSHTHTVPGHTHEIPLTHTHTATTSVSSTAVNTNSVMLHHLIVNKIIKF